MAEYKVLHLIDSSGMYGAERVVLTMLQGLRDTRFAGILGCISEAGKEIPEIAREANNLGISVKCFPMKRGVHPLSVRTITDFVRKNSICIVHSHGYKPNILMGIMPRKLFRVVSTVHGWAKQTGGIKMRMYEFLDAQALKRMDCVVAVSRGVERDLLSRGIRKKKVRIIYNGIAFDNPGKIEDLASLRERLGISVGSFVIGTLGRLTAVKGQAFLIRAMPSILSEIKDCKLLIAGEGTLKGNLEHMINEMSLTESVRLVGYVKDIGHFLSVVDLFILPSLSEGLPISLLEAMGFGKPVVASAVGGITEIITDENEGVLIPPADSNAISIAIRRLFREAEKRKEIASAGREAVRNKFSARVMATQYSNLYSNLASCPAK